jgi:hypothetical protein
VIQLTGTTPVIRLYPNPGGTQFSLMVSSPDYDEYHFTLRDLAGRILESRILKSTVTYEFGALLQNGIYLAEIRLGDEVKVLRVIKQ